VGSPALTELVVSGLRGIGVEVTPEYVDLPRLFAAKLSGDYDLAITLYPGPSGAGPMGDPDYLRTIYSSRVAPGFHGAQRYSDPELDDLADRQLVTLDAPKRKQLVARMQEIVARDLPVLPLYYSTLFFAYRKSVFDQWYYTPGGGFGPGIPEPFNKHAYVTGQKTGLQVRPIRE
jgi:peptide/nickel transport system substrate-binding protein